MEEKSTQQSRAIAVVSIILVLIVISLIAPLVWKGQPKKKQLKPRLDLSQIAKPEEVIADSNNDGVISWREVMMSTTNPSSSTLAELKKIPVDKKAITELNDPNNLTSSFAKNIYLAGVYLDKNGITDDQSKQDIVTQLMENEKGKIVRTTYNFKDLHVAKTESKDSIRTYGNKLATLLKEIVKEEFLKGDVYAISTYTESKNPNDLKDLISNKKRLDTLMQKLISLEVPPSATIYHLLVINKAAAYKDIVETLSNSESDPLKTTFVINDYPSKVQDISLLNTTIYNYFTYKNIIFSSKEPGYLFTTGYTIKK